MAQTEAEIRVQLIQLYNMRNTGVFSVRDGETSTQFRSLKELNELIASLEGALPDNATARRRRPRYIVQRSKGL